MVFPSSSSVTMQRGKKGTVAAKARSLRRAELLILEAQHDFLEHRVRDLEKNPHPPTTVRKLKREPNGPPISDRPEGNKRAKHDVGGSMTVDEMFNQCRKLLTQLKKNNNSGPFLTPVDPIALNCPDYTKIVTQPMDFKTITAKLRPTKRQYESPLEFRDDVRQVFKNCSLYNPVGHQIRNMGDRLSAIFESFWVKSNLERYYQKLQEVLKREKDVNREMLEEGNGERSKKKRMRKPEDALKKLAEIHTKMQELMTCAADKMEIEERDEHAPFSFWQKRKLSVDLENAPISVLVELGKGHPEETGTGGKEEMVIDELDDETLRRLLPLAASSHLPAETYQEQTADSATATEPTVEEAAVESVPCEGIAETDVPQKETMSDPADAPPKETSAAAEVMVEEEPEAGEEENKTSVSEDDMDVVLAAEKMVAEEVVTEEVVNHAPEDQKMSCKVEVIEEVKHSDSGKEEGKGDEFVKGAACEEDPTIHESLNGADEVTETKSEACRSPVLSKAEAEEEEV